MLAPARQARDQASAAAWPAAATWQFGRFSKYTGSAFIASIFHVCGQDDE